MSITRSQIARQLYANGGYSDFASPSSTTASQDFSTQAMSGGSNGGGSSYDYIPQPPMAQVSTTPIREGGDNNPYGLRSKFQKGLDEALPYLAGFIGSKLGPYQGYKSYNLAKTNVEKQQEELNQFTNAINTGSFYVPGQTGLPEGLIAKSDSLLGFQNRAPNPFMDTGGGGDNIIPRLPMIAQTPSDIEGRPSDFDLYAALEGREGMRFGENPYATRGTTQRFADGGLASLRQNYKLGKLVKKATDAVKKIAKSDVGKAALLYAGGTYLGGMKAFGGSGIAGKQGLKNFGFEKFGGRLLNPTGKDGISNFLLNPFGKPTPETPITDQSVKNFAEKYGITNSEALKYLTSQQKTPIPGYVKYGIPAAMAATYFLSKKEKPDDLNQEMAQNYKDTSGLKEQLATYKPFRFQVPKDFQLVAQGGRIGYEMGGDIDPADLPMSKEGFPRYEDELGEEVPYPYDNQEMASDPDPMAELFQMYQEAIRSGQIPRSTTFDEYKELRNEMSSRSMGPQMLAYGGRIGYEEGGLMNLGGMEKDYRAEGGFVPIGGKEKADDVPARLSKNEFVFTADAVRNAGEGDIDKGAEVMENVMKHLEAGGTVSEESQGLAGARKMFQTSQRLGEVL